MVTQRENGKAAAVRRTYRGEEAWVELYGELAAGGSLAALRQAFIEAGVSPQIAGNLVWFLHDQGTLDRHQSDFTRARYRKELAGLDVDRVRKAAAKLAIPG